MLVVLWQQRLLYGEEKLNDKQANDKHSRDSIRPAPSHC